MLSAVRCACWMAPSSSLLGQGSGTQLGLCGERTAFQKMSASLQKKFAFIKDLIYFCLFQKGANHMNLDKFLNMKPKLPSEKMDIENPERQQALPWVEKYRPNKLQDLTYQEEVIRSLTNVLKTGNMPHLLFYGPAGTGKTSTILALSKQLFGPKFYKQRVLELNASDERGISVIRDKVKKFAQQICIRNADKNYLCPNYKVIVLDEADLMTTDAQSALRRVIQDNSNTTRFCIICNYITKIIEPLASRCVKFRFKPIPLDAQLSKLQFIAQSEGVQLQQRQIKVLLEKGDLRQSINTLQSFNRLTNIPLQLLPVDQNFGQEVLSRIQRCETMKDVFELGVAFGLEGYACDQMLTSLCSSILKSGMEERKKSLMLQTLSRAEQSLVLGATELPLVEVLTSLYYIINLSI